ncbi:Selenocysteine lyase/Cysteine desulfurase [Pseudonocardia thermophila]|uniref:Selenocysteine lyase/Cysteine desulfurase n=1 Tax=Pseudonocardia thermophila TaxID=1848 RepID=A0A1M6Z060_PSETH|nr:aminotransferase class V-fold PLP-dependent enzyme [Pseudonocardia thermophila]SHL23934.1 Selenocysteine lyase/Cysteine desulfurase [Pseudonocardia thermophila]
MSSALASLPAVLGADLQVPLVTGECVGYANLDHAASAPALAAVAEHVAEVIPFSASVHRGAGYASQVCTSLLETARATIGRFLGARADDAVVFTRSTTDALNLLATAVPGRVLCLDVEHHANLLPWRDVRRVPAAATIEQTLTDLATALAEEEFALVAVTGASNVTGEALPIADVVALARAAGARVALDAAQLAPHRRVDIAAWGVDYVAISGHKLYAPYGAGVLAGRADWLDAAPPFLAGGGATLAVDTCTVRWASGAQRHEAGSPNVVGAAALAQACRTLAPVLTDAAPEHERVLSERLSAGLAEIPGVTELSIWSDSTDKVGVHAFTVADRPAGYVAAYLSAEHGIGVRDGKFCAHPLLDRLNPGSGAALRASFGLGTTTEHIDRLVEALDTLVRRGSRWTYAPVDGRWAPTPDPRPRDPFGVGAA